MEIVQRHYHEWLIYNHAWDPISGSALEDEPTLNPEAESHCQKAGFTASTAYHLKTYHCTGSGHHRRLFEKKYCGLQTDSKPMRCVSQGSFEEGGEGFGRRRDKQV